MAGGLRAGYKVQGLSRVVRELQALGLDVEDLKDAFGNLAAKGVRAAQGFVPRRSGALEGTVRGNRAKNKAVITAGRARVPYAAVINYGWKTRNIDPSGFMQRTDDVMRPVAVEEVLSSIEQTIKRRGL